MKAFFRSLRFLALLLLYAPAAGFAQVTVTVQQTPTYYTPLLDTLFIAGTFNNWNPGDPAYALLPNGNGGYSTTLTAAQGSTVEYKFTRGGWDRVETQAGGGFLPNRSFTYNGPATIADSIRDWDDLAGPHTAVGSTRILDLDFGIPQFNRTRRVWIYFPQGYDNSSQRYPVVYMHDGQNLFDELYTAFGTEWAIDESMEDIQNNQGLPAIVVGVDNGGGNRIAEYTPWSHPQYGGGDGEAYVDFLVQTLKPFIDANFRTLPQREYTAIAGSSLGGLISFYAALERPDIFSKAGVFSPSFWFSDSAFVHAAAQGHSQPMRIYMVGGDNESATMVPNMYRMRDTLLAHGFSAGELNLVSHADGQHSEWYWAREYPACFNWLFQGTSLSAEAPGPAAWALGGGVEGRFRVHGPAGTLVDLRLTDLQGREYYRAQVGNGDLLELGNAPAGILLARFGDGPDSLFQKVLKR